MAVLPLYRGSEKECIVRFTIEPAYLERWVGEGKMECCLSDLLGVHSCSVVDLRDGLKKKKE